jgi:Zn-dependent peptidase ImmA (M78 family)/transcriptional regulator with XRE-family HTH domain
MGDRMTRVAVNQQVLRWAIERSGLPPEVLRKHFPNIQEWESGDSQPTLRQLEDLAKRTRTPLGYLFLSKAPEDRLPIPHFRTIADEPMRRPSPNLIETVHVMERRQVWMREFMLEQGQEPVPFVRSAALDEAPSEIAPRIRSKLGLTEGWAARHATWKEALQSLFAAVEAAGILFVANGIVRNNPYRKLDPNEFRGFVLVDEYAPLVFVNGADGKAAQMFTLAHELAHVWFGASAAFDLREMRPAADLTEQACNKVAAELLVPETELGRVWPAVRRDPRPFQAVARHFKVSEIVAARRAFDLQFITRKDFLTFYEAYQERERAAASKEEGGNFYKNQNRRVGQRFARSVIQAVKDGKLLYSDAYRLTDLYGKAFDNYAYSLGVWATS